MSFRVRLLFAASLMGAAPLLAQSKNQTDDPAEMTEQQLANAAERGRGASAVCGSAIFANELERRNPNAGTRSLAARRRGTCFWLRKDYPAALRELAASESLLDRAASQELRAELDYMLVWSAAEAGDKAAIETHAMHVARRDDAEEFAEADFGIWRIALMRAGSTERGRIALVFAKAKAFESLGDRMKAVMAYQAIQPAIMAGETKLAFALATREPDPKGMMDLLIDRSYAPIWPHLEKHVGPAMSRELAANLAHAESALKSAPGSHDKIRAVMGALLWLDRPAEALAIAQHADHSDKAFAKPSEDFGWLIEAEVKALDMLDQTQVADALFDRLVVVGAGKGREWMVNFAINRANRLVAQGRWAEAMPASELSVKLAAEYGSPYAKVIAAVDRYCAKIRLEPTSPELADWWREIEEWRLSNVGAAVLAAQCKGDDAAARRFIRDGLESTDSRDQALMLLQNKKIDSDLDGEGAFTEPRLLLAGDRALQNLFSKYGRMLPEALLPR